LGYVSVLNAKKEVMRLIVCVAEPVSITSVN
jgi:hypothetical protein